METDAKSIIENIRPSELESVVRNETGEPAALVSGNHTWQAIDAVHNDQRTRAIVRVSGQAMVGGAIRDWSCVVKLIDPSLESGDAAAWNDPTIEEKVYELGLFADSGVPLRPARCFGISQVDERTKLIWLEDMGKAPQPPWTAGQYMSAARHAGEFNGLMTQEPPVLPFELPVDVHRARRNAMNGGPAIQSLLENSSHPLLRAALQDVPAESVAELDSLCGELHETTPRLPHGIAFGDFHARNLFPLGHETVAIDWAGLASDPVGADLSVLVGSGFSWGIDEAIMVGQSEPAIFEAYMDGLKASGWSGTRNDVRRAFFTHLPMYLAWAALLTDGIRSGRANARRDWVEARRGASFEEIPEKMAPIVALIPGYVSELRQLLE